MVGETISHYKVVGQLGAGGMGVVYRAEDVRLGRPVALKFISEELAHDPHAVQRLRSEARAASALNHPNICTIYDVGEHEEHPFIVMELMKGRTLRDWLTAGALKVHQMVDIGIETADALHAAHSEGIIHRDVKPGNIFVTDRGHVKILDFGLAKLTQSVASGTTRDVAHRTGRGITLGTIAYMSPEQATGEELDGRTDLFSLGVVLYECATGRHPFPGKTSAVILEAILNRAPVAPVMLNPELPVRLQDVINNCLEKDRELRYQSAADLRADLKRVRRDIDSGHSRAVDAVSLRSGTAAASGSGAAPARPERRRSLAWRLGAPAAIVAAAAGLYSVWPDEPPPLESQCVAPAPDSAVSSRLGLATASLEARNYRAALAYAGQVLALDATHAEAMRVRDEARAMLERFDAALADARRRAAAGDLPGAARALEVARGIDPASSSVAETASRLAALSGDRERAADAARRSRSGASAPASPATGPATSGTAADAMPQPSASAPATTASAPSPTGSSPSTPAPPLPSASAAGAATAPAPAPRTVAPSPPAPAAPVATDSRERPQDPPATPSPEEDDAALRRVTAAYAQAIESKDLALFRSVKPNLSAEEERRLREGFRAVDSQRVDLTILSIDRRGDEAAVVLRRRDTIQAGGRQHTAESQQTMTLARTGGGWKIVDIR